MSFIIFNFEKKHIFLIVGILIYILDEYINIKFVKIKEKINFLNYFSKIFLIFPYLFIIKFLSKNNNNNNFKNKSKISKIVVNLNNTYNFKILPDEKKLRNFILKLLIFYFFSELYYNLINFYNSRKQFKIHKYKISLFILIIYFNKIIFKEKFFVHHYLTTFILIIFLLILTINKWNKKYLLKGKFLLILIFFFIKNFYFIFFIQKFNPCLYGIIMFGSSAFYYLADANNKDKYIKNGLKYFFRGSFIFSFFFLFIFSENIQFNFCGLNEQTIKQKQILSKIEEMDLQKSVSELNNESKTKSEISYFE